MNRFKVAIIGGGPGGYVTAIRLKQYGIDTVVFEKERLGGVCLNWGCIPTKSMVKVAELYHEIKEAKNFGIQVADSNVDFPAVMTRKDNVVEKLVSGIEFVFKKKEIPVINEIAKSIEKTDNGYIITSQNEKVEVDYVIMATGSKPKELPFMQFDGETILSSKHILSLKELPKELVVVGGGVIGCEFATIFAQFGTKVTIVEFLPSLVALEDAEISKRLGMALKKSKIKIITKTGVESYEKLDNGKVQLNLSNGKKLETSSVLVSVGRVPVVGVETKGFDLDLERGAITINDKFETNQKNIFAIGDATAKLMLAHTASKQGLIVADIIRNEVQNKNKDILNLVYENIPRCTFTNPEIGSVGLTEEQAKEKYEEILIGKFPFSANGKSLGLGNQFGFVKAIADKTTNKLIGMHIIGPQATELIAQGSILINSGATIQDVEKVVFAHPTLSECVMEAVEDLEHLSVHTV